MGKYRLLALNLLTFAPLVALAESGTSLSSLEALMEQTVISVSRKEEKASEAASAIFVVTQEDIKRLGATTIGDALRIVPGLHVANIDSAKLAISSRGFNAPFANKLLVMIDGRTVYTPLFSGTYWEVQNLLMDDIDRIEVVRGPGASMWGANAVNGVINIITKSAEYTQGSYISLGAGNEEQFAEGRYGGKISDNTYYRSYAKTQLFDQTTLGAGIGNNDDWFISKAGVRLDTSNDLQTDELTFDADVYYSERNWLAAVPVTFFPFIVAEDFNDNSAGGHVLGRWQHRKENGDVFALQGYVDSAFRDSFTLEQHIITADVDFQYDLKPQGNHDILWGAGYRHLFFDFESTAFAAFEDEQSNEYVLNTFIQDKYTVVPNKLFLTVGSKFEYNSYTKFEYQPSIRASWLIDSKQTLWAAVSRSVRTPSKAENEIILLDSGFPEDTFGPGTPEGFVFLEGSMGAKAEKVVSYEVGYRVQPSSSLAFDASVYFNDYNDLVTTELGDITVDFGGGDPLLRIPFSIDSRGSASGYGFELAVTWSPAPYWELLGAYTYLGLDLDVPPATRDTRLGNVEELTPRHQFNIRSRLDLSNNVQFDNMLFFVDDLEGVDEYLRFDTKLSWKPWGNRTELAVIGRNLLDGQHPEFSEGLFAFQTQVERSVLGQIKVYF